MAKKQSGREIKQKLSPMGYLISSLVAFLIGLGILLLFILKGKDIVALGLGDNVYYVLLIPMALAAAGFLFGVLRSYAVYKGKVFSGALGLGGPAVIFVLVLILGFWLLPKKDEPFTFTIRLRDIKGEAVLKGEGKLRLILDTDTRVMAIDGEGGAVFTGIPASFTTQPAPVELDAPGWQFVKADANDREKKRIICPMTGKAAMLTIEKDDSLSTLGFSVTDGNRQPVAGAVVLVEGQRLGETGTLGMLSILLPKSLQKPELAVAVHKEGYKIWEGKAYPATGVQVKVVLE